MPANVMAQSVVLPSTMVAVAEPAKLRISVTSNQEVVISSFLVPSPDDFKILKVGNTPFKAPNDHWVANIEIEFMVLNEGPIEIPGLTVPYRTKKGTTGSFQTPPVKITGINSVAPEASPEELRDIKGPIQISNVWLWIVLALTALLLIAAGIFFFRNKKNKTLADNLPAEPPRPLREVVFEKLDAARNEYRKSGKLKEFYIAISDILREYLGKRFGVESLERTTSEIFLEMKKRKVERMLCIESKDLLSQCDLVKFAKFAPLEPDVESDFRRIREFVEKTHALG